jgi:hypothetical protein
MDLSLTKEENVSITSNFSLAESIEDQQQQQSIKSLTSKHLLPKLTGTNFKRQEDKKATTVDESKG